jgi:hypothetical protein
MDPLTVLAALGPLAVDLGKGLIARFIAPEQFKPASIVEWLQMRTADLELYKAMNEAGGSQASYPWVEAIVRLQRPTVAAVTLLVWGWSHTYGQASPEIDNFAGAVGFYLFGDRTLFHAKRAIAAATAKP